MRTLIFAFCIMIKKELRKLYKEKRQSISDRERMKMDDLLLIQFQKMFLEQVDVLFTYWPLSDAAEPNTLLFTRYMHHMIPGLHIAYPITDFSALSMQAILVNEDTDYHTNNHGITEPREGEVIPPEMIDVVFVPMLICDKDGYRVGFGKGFYDRFLPKCRRDVLKIGFSYFDPIDKIDDTDAYDVPLNFCITPERIYEMQG